MKRILTILIALFAVQFSYAASIRVKIGDLYYNLDTSKLTAEVTYEKANDNHYENLRGALSIPETVAYQGSTYTVTSIGNEAFNRCSDLTSVTIGNSVTSIGKSAFRSCSFLTSVTIGNSVTSIGDWAFGYCNRLTSVTIPNSVTYIGSFAFEYCSGLTNVTIPNSITSIGDWAFYECRSLTSITIGNSVTSIGDWAFGYCNRLTSVTIGNSVTSIGKSAFSHCTGLTSVTIPNSVTSIGDYAFSGCSGLTSVTIPNSVTYIGGSAFGSCRKLTGINVDNGNPAFTSIDGVLYNKNLDTIIRYPGALQGEFEIPNSVTSIGSYAFSGCEGLTSVTIGNSVTSIGSYAFSGCEGLTSVTIGNSVTSIGDYAFSACSGLISVKIGNSVTSIGDLAFYGCSGLRSVTIPNSVTSIGDLAFYGCSGLTGELDIPNSVTEIGDAAFYECTSLTSITIGNSVTSIGSYAFYGCSGLISLTIGNSVTSIGKYAFHGCSGLTSIILTDGMKNLTFEDETFDISELYLGRNLSGQYSFPKVRDLTVGGFVTNIPTITYNQTTLASVIINPGARLVIEDGAFSGLSNLETLILPEDIAEIGANAFSGTGLKNITVPGGIIGDNAFANCNLDNIILGKDVESIGEYAFDGSNAIKNVYATPTTPPAAQNNTFSSYEAQLWVPEEAIDTYYNNTRCWYRFSGKPLVCPENITLSGPASFSGKPGETLQLTATISPANVTLDRVLWRSTNPAVATVDNNGLVTFHNFASKDETMTLAEEESTGFCQIIASTLYEESPMAVVNIEVSVDSASIEYINSDEKGTSPEGSFRQNDIYTLQGVCLKHNASQDDINALAPGIYIIGGKKVIIR